MHDEFQTSPKIAWDMQGPGQSSTVARLYQQLGYDALFFASEDIDFSVKPGKKVEHDSHQMEFLWNTADNQSIFTSMIAGEGCTPDDLFFDAGSKGYQHNTDDPFVADKAIGDEFNARNRTHMFVQMINNRIRNDRKADPNHIVIPWGCDNSFTNAKASYKQTEAFIKYFNG